MHVHDRLARGPGLGAYASLLPLAALLVVGTGCQRERVRVEMAAGSGEVQRTFASNTLDEAGVRRLTDTYNAAPQRDASVRGLRFEGRFGTELPTEVGNRSGLSEIASDLGSAWFYYEAFGEGGGRHGDDWSALMQRMHAGDLWVRIFGRWAERQIADGPERERFRVIVESELVPMSRNIMLRYAAMQSIAQSQRIGGRIREADEEGARSDDESFWQQTFVPLLIAMGEEGIFTPAELQRLFLLSLDGRAGGDSRQWALDEIFVPAITRQVRTFRPEVEQVTVGQIFAMGVSFWLFANGSPERDDLLLTSPAIPESDKQKLRAGDRAVRLPPPFGIEPRRRVTTTDTEVRLRVAAVPYLTNGVVESTPDGATVIVFRAGFTDADNRSVVYEPVFHAAWTEPESARQQSLFGAVLLRGEELAEYCLWHDMLEPEERGAWAEALATLATSGKSEAMIAVMGRLSTRRTPPKALQDWATQRQ